MADLFLVPYVRAVWQMLGHRLGTAGRMGIYGAGAHTRWLLAVTDDLPRLPIECIIDDGVKQQTLGGLAVCRPNEVDIEAIDLVLISSDQWEERLVDGAREHWGDRVELVRLYDGLPAGPYDKNDDRMEALRRLRSSPVEQSIEANEVVIVSDRPGPREAKIGYGLRHAGWRTVLLHRDGLRFDTRRCFDEAHAYSHAWEALRRAGAYRPAAYQVMVNTDYRTAELFVRHRPGVVVVDSYDLVAGMYTDEYLAAYPAYAAQIDRERYCLENADGVCTRSRECDYLQEECGYTYRDYLYFPDGCWNDPEPVSPLDGEIHVAYAGGVTVEKSAPGPFAEHGYRLWLAKALADQGFHFHLYPAFSGTPERFEETFSAYRRLEGESRYVHLHKPCAMDRIARELSQYSLAIFVYNQFSGLPEMRSQFTAAKLRCCTSNKFYDYLDASLPIIHNAGKDSLLSQIVNEYGAGIDVRDHPVGEWGRLLRSLNLKELRQRAGRARQAYDVRHWAPKLVAFYQRLHAGAASQDTMSTASCEEPSYANG